MSKQAKRRAEDVAAMPHVQRWMRRLRKLAADMPPEVEAYVAGGTLCVLARTKDGDSFAIREAGHMEGSDPDAVVGLVAGGRWDGGDW